MSAPRARAPLPEPGALDLDLSRAAFYGLLLLLFWDRPFAAYGEVPASLYAPPPLHRLLGLPPPGPWVGGLGLAWKLSLAAAAAGLLTRVSTALAFLLGFYLLALDWAFGYAHHRFHLVVVCSGVLALSDCGRRVSLDRLLARRSSAPPPAESWPLHAARLCWCAAYFGAGLAKLRAAGAAYFLTDHFRHFLETAPGDYGRRASAAQTAAHAFVLARPWLYRGAAFAGLALELASPAALFSRRLAAPLVLGMALMHAGAYFVLFLRFKEIAPAYAFWVPWTALAEALRRRRR